MPGIPHIHTILSTFNIIRPTRTLNKILLLLSTRSLMAVDISLKEIEA